MDALLVMIVGMLGVFIFLLVLIQVMRAVCSFLPPTAEELAGPKPRRPSAASGSTDDSHLIAVLQAAVVAYESETNPR